MKQKKSGDVSLRASVGKSRSADLFARAERECDTVFFNWLLIDVGIWHFLLVNYTN
jgi:hypothetical protein